MNKWYYYTRTERNSIIVLSAIIVVLILIRPVIIEYRTPEFVEVEKTVFDTIYVHNYDTVIIESKPPKEFVKQAFDPNLVSGEQLARMGLSKFTIKNWLKYRAAGGKFLTKEDVKNIYGVEEKWCKEYQGLIRLKQSIPNKKSRVSKKSTLLEINNADSLELIKLKGIGPVFAKRILKYRELLGGFYGQEQLREVYGMDSVRYDQLVRQIELDTTAISYVNVNQDSIAQLGRHPYINWNLAKHIVKYRQQHGFYRKSSDLLEIKSMDTIILHKVSPYLKY